MYEIVGKLQQFDERDQGMARAGLVLDSELWKKYYREHPELEEQGRRWATLPGIGQLGPLLDINMEAAMEWTINLMCKNEDVDGEPSPAKIVIEPERASEKLKAFARHLGADLVGIGPLNQAWVYSHVGNSHFPGKTIGAPINLPHQHAIVVAIHLNLSMVEGAPQLPILLETMRAYMRLASIVVTLAKYIRSLGYPSRAHNLWNYQVLLVPLAIDAGLGEQARNNIMITKEYGMAIKMAAVTTDIPLMHDKPVNLGVDEFCSQCKICVEYCPVGAITRGGKEVVRGARKWQLKGLTCFEYLATVGTDCGICMAVCPLGKPKGWHYKRAETPAWLEEEQPEVWREALKEGHPLFK